jgi:hypothetical protein
MVNANVFEAANLTTWGFNDCQRDMNNGCKGGQSAYHTYTACVMSLTPIQLPNFCSATSLAASLMYGLTTHQLGLILILLVTEFRIYALPTVHARAYEGKLDQTGHRKEVHV